MKLRHLEEALQCVRPFESPDVRLEQYPTSPHLASRVLFAADASFGDVAGRTVADFGCGTGMFAIGAEILGAASVVGFDCDEDALRIARARVGAARKFDTVLMNPPFGTRVKGADMVFLRAAFDAASVVYSLHKTSTRDHIVRTTRGWGAEVRLVAELRFDIAAVHAFHRDRSRDIEVDLLRLSRPGEARMHLGPPPPIPSAAAAANADAGTAGAAKGRGKHGGGTGRGRGRGGRGGGRSRGGGKGRR